MAYQIIRTPNYYQGTLGAPQEKFVEWADLDDNLLNDPHGLIAEWDTIQEAQAIIDDWQDGPYYCSHGEAGAPSYRIVEDYDFGDDCYPCDDDELGDGWTMVDMDILPDDVSNELDGANVTDHSYHDVYDVYVYFTERNDTRYAIVFCPKTLALQLHADDLGNVDWDNAGYFIAKN